MVAAIDSLTHRKGESHEAFIARLGDNPMARRVKLADLEDNLDILRLRQVTAADSARLERYIRAWRVLETEA